MGPEVINFDEAYLGVCAHFCVLGTAPATGEKSTQLLCPTLPSPAAEAFSL